MVSTLGWEQERRRAPGPWPAGGRAELSQGWLSPEGAHRALGSLQACCGPAPPTFADTSRGTAEGSQEAGVVATCGWRSARPPWQPRCGAEVGGCQAAKQALRPQVHPLGRPSQSGHTGNTL